MCEARYTQITQNNNFAISLWYLKKEVSDEVDFSHTDKYENLLQIDAMIFIGKAKHSQSSQNSQFAMTLYNISEKVMNGVHFVHADKHQSFY